MHAARPQLSYERRSPAPFARPACGTGDDGEERVTAERRPGTGTAARRAAWRWTRRQRRRRGRSRRHGRRRRGRAGGGVPGGRPRGSGGGAGAAAARRRGRRRARGRRGAGGGAAGAGGTAVRRGRRRPAARGRAAAARRRCGRPHHQPAHHAARRFDDRRRAAIARCCGRCCTQSGRTQFNFIGTRNGDPGCGVSGYDRDNEGHGGYIVTDILKAAGTGVRPGGADPAIPTCRTRAISRPGSTTSRPTSCCMHFGTNDVWNNIAPATILNAYTAILGQLRGANPNVRVLVAQIMPLQPRAASTARRA